MNEIIWFFGSSAAGKKTLIESILKNSEIFKAKFNIENTKIKANENALIWVTKKNHNERLNLINEIKEEFEKDDNLSILIKGQTPDLDNFLLDKLVDTKQKIIFVYTNPKEEVERLKTCRHWWTQDIDEQYVLDEIKYEIPFLEKLQSKGIPIICINGGSDADYEIIEFPPIK